MELRLPELKLDTEYVDDLLDLLMGIVGLQALHLTAASISPELYNRIAAKQLPYFQFDRIPSQPADDYAFAIVSLHSKTFINADTRLHDAYLPEGGITSVAFQVADIDQIQYVGTIIAMVYKQQNSCTATSISVGVRPDCATVDDFISAFFGSVVKEWALSGVLVDVSLVYRGFVVAMTKPTIGDRVKIRLTIHDTSYIRSRMDACLIAFTHFWSVTIASDFPPKGAREGFESLSNFLHPEDIDYSANDQNAFYVLQMTVNLEELQIDSPAIFEEFITSYATNVRMLLTALGHRSYADLVVLGGNVHNAKEMEKIPFPVLKEHKTPQYLYVQSLADVAEDQTLLRPYGYKAIDASKCRREDHPKGICLEKTYVPSSDIIADVDPIV